MAASPDWSGVTNVIAAAEGEGCTLGVAVISPSGARFSHNGGRGFIAASTVKIAIMIELFRQVEAGRHSLDTRVPLRAGDRTGGSGVLMHLDPGMEPTLRDLAYLMMAISDNMATNLLIDTVGQPEVNAAMRSLGMPASVLGRKMRGRPMLDGEAENTAVPDEYAGMIAAILGRTAASADCCAAMVALLEKQQNDRRLARHLPRVDRPRWGSKTGSLVGVVNDVGFIMTPTGPLVLAVFSEHVADPLAGEATIGAIARAALAAVG